MWYTSLVYVCYSILLCVSEIDLKLFVIQAFLCFFVVQRYEGTGRSLSLKLIQQLRQQCTTYGGSVKEARLAAEMAKKGSEAVGTGQ